MGDHPKWKPLPAGGQQPGQRFRVSAAYRVVPSSNGVLKVAESDGLAFFVFWVGGHRFCVILGDYHRSRYPRAHAPCPLEPLLYYARVLAQRVTRALDPLVARLVSALRLGP